MKGRDNLVDLAIDGRIIVVGLQEIVYEDVDWIHLA